VVRRTSRDDIALGLLIACTGAAVLPLRRFGLIVNDEGWLLHPVLRMLDGEILYRDVWVHYAPLRYHAVAGLFSVTGPSLLVSRTLLGLLIVASAAGLFCLARRFSPRWLAWLPGAVYALAPGPWHKAPYAFCTVVWLLALVRALELPTRPRLVALGLAIGLSLGTRHDLGLLQVVLTVAVVVAYPGLGAIGPAPRRRALAWVGLPAGLAVVPLVAWYWSQGALTDLADALFVRAFAQAAGSPIEPLVALLSPTSFGATIEGGRAGALLLAPPFVYAAFAAVWVLEVRRGGITPRTILGGTLLATALATLPQVYLPPLVARFLQSAAPCYLLATWLVAELVRRADSRFVAAAAGLTACAAGAAVVWLAVAGIPRIQPWPDYTGSWRLRRDSAPVLVLGDRIFTSFQNAEEIRLVRAFLHDRAPADQPVFAWPWLSLYYVLLERPNPTRAVFERILPGDFAMTSSMKHREMERLLASDARYALVWKHWWRNAADGDEVRVALARAFAPVRRYGDVIIFERTSEPDRLTLGEISRRMERGEARDGDVESLMDLARSNPREPLPLLLLAKVAIATGQHEHAATMIEFAAGLDPHDAAGLEWLAAHALRSGRVDEAAALVQRARSIRDSPMLRRLDTRLPAEPGFLDTGP
jgi:hypothetical protein